VLEPTVPASPPERIVSVNSIPVSVDGDRTWYKRLRRIVASTEDRPDDPQRLRALYLLSLGLQDSTLLEGLPPAEGESRSDEALRYAKELTIRIEEAIRQPGVLPDRFVRNNRGIALALTASQITPTTNDLTQVSTSGSVPAETSSDYVLGLLRNPGPGVPEKLIAFVKGNCRIDDQVNYHLCHYYFNRAEISAQNAAACQAAARNATGQEREIMLAQLRDLERTEQDALTEMVTHRAAIGEDADPVLLARVRTLDGAAAEFRSREWPARDDYYPVPREHPVVPDEAFRDYPDVPDEAPRDYPDVPDGAPRDYPTVPDLPAVIVPPEFDPELDRGFTTLAEDREPGDRLAEPRQPRWWRRLRRPRAPQPDEYYPDDEIDERSLR
jgi:hypothetical protein